MSGPTPGPWEVCGLWVCEENDPGHNVGICVVEKRDEANANAQLIAAAPDLLAALKDFLNVHGGQGEWDSEIQYFERARAAIAKATGAVNR